MIEPLQSDAAFLADVQRATRESPEKLHLWWLGQSGYLLQHRGTTLLIDPYLSDSLTTKYHGTARPHVRMHRRVVDPGELGRALGPGLTITSSHAHTDHLDPDTLRPLIAGCQYAQFVFPHAHRQLAIERSGGDWQSITPFEMNSGPSLDLRGVSINPIPAAHDVIDRDDRGYFRYFGYVFDLRANRGEMLLDSLPCPPDIVRRVYHSGDTVVYKGLAERVRELGPIDIAILPINGKVGNMGGRDAARLAKESGARLVIPCHYDMFEFNTADPLDEFIPECERLGQAYRVLQLGERLTL